MKKLAKLASPLNWRHQPNARLPQFFVLTDVNRLADPVDILHRLPRGAAVILRHTDPDALAQMARRIIPRAHRLGLKVLLSGDVRLAVRLNADGVHLPERLAKRGPGRIHVAKPNFIVTVAAHSRLALWRAARAGADLSVLSQAFASDSHPGTKALGLLRFLTLAKHSPVPVVALGGVNVKNARRLRVDVVVGLGAVGAWRA